MYARTWDEILNKRNLNMFDTNVSPNFANKNASNTINGPAEAKEYFIAVFKAFSEIDYVADEIFGTENRIVKRWTFNGTHTGEFNGIAPTGKRITLKGVSIVRIVNGKIEEELDYMDDLGFLQQLGVIPPTGS